MTDGPELAAEKARVAHDLDRQVRIATIAHLSAEAGQRPGARILTATATNDGTCSFEAIVQLARGTRLVRVTTEVVE